jgi:hypothetical protein
MSASSGIRRVDASVAVAVDPPDISGRAHRSGAEGHPAADTAETGDSSVLFESPIRRAKERSMVCAGCKLSICKRSSSRAIEKLRLGL